MFSLNNTNDQCNRWPNYQFRFFAFIMLFVSHYLLKWDSIKQICLTLIAIILQKYLQFYFSYTVCLELFSNIDLFVVKRNRTALKYFLGNMFYWFILIDISNANIIFLHPFRKVCTLNMKFFIYFSLEMYKPI